MRVFKDKSGVEWKIDLTIGLVECIKDKMEIDLLEPVGESSGDSPAISLSMLNIANIRKLSDLLFALCEDQCIEREVDRKHFLDALSLHLFYVNKPLQSLYYFLDITNSLLDK